MSQESWFGHAAMEPVMKMKAASKVEEIVVSFMGIEKVALWARRTGGSFDLGNWVLIRYEWKRIMLGFQGRLYGLNLLSSSHGYVRDHCDKSIGIPFLWHAMRFLIMTTLCAVAHSRWPSLVEQAVPKTYNVKFLHMSQPSPKSFLFGNTNDHPLHSPSSCTA